MRNTTIPSLEDFREEAKQLKKNNPKTIKTHGQALQKLAKKYGHKSWEAIRVHLVPEKDREKSKNKVEFPKINLSLNTEAGDIKMQPNLIPIFEISPLYPAEYIEILVNRVKTIFLGEDILVKDEFELTKGLGERVVCDIFTVKSVDELIDKNKIVKYYDIEPSLTKNELHGFAKRLSGYIKDEDEAVFIVRNILNSTPKSIDDLEDYITKESLRRMNGIFAFTLGIDPINSNSASGLLTDFINKENADKIETMTLIGMMSKKDGKIEDIAGYTKRQKMLGRGAEYWILSQYGNPAASFWLSQFLAPLNFSSSDHASHPERHFGFMDAEASVSLVMNNIGKIQRDISRAEKSVPMGDVSIEEINRSNMTVVINAIETLYLLDEKRERQIEITKLFDFIDHNYSLLDALDLLRFDFMIILFSELYKEYHWDAITYEPENFYTHLYEIIESNEKSRLPDSPWVSDVINFYLKAKRENQNDGMEFIHMITFAQAMFNAQTYKMMGNLFLSEIDELDKKDIKYGYLKYLPVSLTRRTIGISSFGKYSLLFATSPDILSVVADIGELSGMGKKKELSTSADEDNYWNKRINYISSKEKIDNGGWMGDYDFVDSIQYVIAYSMEHLITLGYEVAAQKIHELCLDPYEYLEDEDDEFVFKRGVKEEIQTLFISIFPIKEANHIDDHVEEIASNIEDELLKNLERQAKFAQLL